MLAAPRGGRRRAGSGEHPLQVGAVPEDRAQTPIQMRGLSQKAGDAPSTPSLDDNRAGRAGLATPEVATLCPKPCRVFPRSPGGMSDSNSAVDDVACEELRELLVGGDVHRRILDTGKTSKLHSTPGDGRPLSSVSTSAGPTPSPEGRTSPLVDRRSAVGGVRNNENIGNKSFKRNATNGGRDVQQERSEALPSQVRKVFVGGIPQDLSQDDLFKFFSEFAQVKKAWLQRCRDTTKIKSPAPHNHRGFGFVIFSDSNAVDQLLGKSFSRYMYLKDGRKLEVKRAVSSGDMTHADPVQQTLDLPHPKSRQSIPAPVPVAPTAIPAMNSNSSVIQSSPPHFSHIEFGQGVIHRDRQQQPQQPQMQQACWSGDPRTAPWMGHSPVTTNMVFASPPWAADGMSPTPHVQQLFPAVAGLGVPLAAPTAVRAPGVLMSGQCGYSPQMQPAPTMGWLGHLQSPTPPPIQMSPGTPIPAMPCGNDVSSQPMMYSQWPQWAPSPGSPAPSHPQLMTQQIVQPVPQNFAQNQIAWAQPPQQMPQPVFAGDF